MSQVVITKRQAITVVGRNVKRIMDEKGMGVRELARASENDGMTVSRLINRHGLPSADALKRIADALAVPIDELFKADK